MTEKDIKILYKFIQLNEQQKKTFFILNKIETYETEKEEIREYSKSVYLYDEHFITVIDYFDFEFDIEPLFNIDNDIYEEISAEQEEKIEQIKLSQKIVNF